MIHEAGDGHGLLRHVAQASGPGPWLVYNGVCHFCGLRSLKLWGLYVDLEESLGTLESTREVYDRIMELRIATPQIVLNYALYLQVGVGPGGMIWGCFGIDWLCKVMRHACARSRLEEC